MVKPLGTAVITIKNSLFENISTPLDIGDSILSAGLDLDFSLATEITSCTIENNIFNGVYAKV